MTNMKKENLKVLSIEKDKDLNCCGVYRVNFTSGNSFSFQIRGDELSAYPSSKYMLESAKEWFRKSKDFLVRYIRNFDFKAAGK